MVDPTILVEINTLEKQKNFATETTLKNLNKLLNYCATFPDSCIRYTKSDVLLKIHSDESYLSAPQAQSSIGGYFNWETILY